ncbi:MAG: hypothetical protein AAGJ81_00470 [Verrucomicrobiota bacterium]
MIPIPKLLIANLASTVFFLSANGALSPEVIEQLGSAGKEAYENHQHLMEVVKEKYPSTTDIQVNAQYERLMSVAFFTGPLKIDGKADIPVPLEVARHRQSFRSFQVKGEGLLGIKQVSFTSKTDGFREAKISQQSDRGFVIEAALASIKEGEPYWMEFIGEGTVDEVLLVNWEGIAVDFNPSLYIAPGLDKPIIDVNVHVDVTAYRAIHGISELQRDRYFRYYASPNMDQSGKEPYFVGKGFLPGRQIEKLGPLLEDRYGAADRLDHLTEDPDRPGYADLSFFDRNVGMFWRFKGVDPEMTFAMCFDNWPSFMEPDVEGIPNIRGTPENYDAATELAVEYLKAQVRDSGRTADWWEVKNESDIQSEWMWHGQEGYDSWGKLADFHIAMADGIRAEFPDVQVGGPASAWIQPHRNDFRVWKNQQRFMDLTKGKMDFYSHHFYEIASNNSYGDQWNGRDGYAQGNLECTLDMLKAHMTKIDYEVPILVTEYGTLNAPNGDIGFWTHVKNVNNMLVNFLDRPQDFDLTVPFLLTYMHWDPHAMESFIHRDEDGEYYKTKNAYFIDLWEDFKGKRVTSTEDHRKIYSFAVLDGNVLRVVLNNRFDQRARINLETTLPEGIQIESARRIKPVFEKGEMLFIDEPVEDLSSIDAGVDVTQIVELTLSDAPRLDTIHNETSWYAPETAIRADQPVTFEVAIDESELSKNLLSSKVRIGVHRPNGFEKGVTVSLNGVESQSLDLSYSKGAQRFFDYFEFDYDPALLKTSNTIEVSFEEPGAVATSAKVVLVSGSI